MKGNEFNLKYFTIEELNRKSLSFHWHWDYFWVPKPLTTRLDSSRLIYHTIYNEPWLLNDLLVSKTRNYEEK